MPSSTTRLRPSLKGTAPGITYESSLWDGGDEFLVGLDEVGRGAWAGPLTVGAVIVPRDRRIYKIRDSKQLKPSERESLLDPIKEWSLAWSVGHASAAECDDLGMSKAQQLAAQRAISNLGLVPDHALVDGPWDFVGSIPTTTIVKGDSISLSIASASIVAKVTRDRLMQQASDTFPWYSFDSNKGYPCSKHRSALFQLGPSTIHRQSWSYMEKLPWNGIEGCGNAPDPLTLF
ncbi:MAG: ribonuclease HII [Actinomycetota bacterium]